MFRLSSRLQSCQREARCPAPFILHFEQNFHDHWHANRKSSGAKNHPHGKLVFAEDIAQQFRSTVCDLCVCDETLVCGQINCQFHHPSDPIEGAEVVPGRGEHVCCCEARGRAAGGTSKEYYLAST